MKKININSKEPELPEVHLYPIGFYFDANVTASQLAYWLATANEYKSHIDKQNSLLTNIGWYVLPGMVNCKSKKARIKFLDASWNEILDYDPDSHNRECLADIGRSFLKSYEKTGEAADHLIEFMRIYNILFIISEMRTGGLSDEEIKNLNKAA
ncbi:MAG TPA: hypothetical protein VMU83_07895 [Hanamia sp.]|nr:hypothetical protein [Hanamia sp.]